MCPGVACFLVVRQIKDLCRVAAWLSLFCLLHVGELALLWFEATCMDRNVECRPGSVDWCSWAIGFFALGAIWKGI